MTLHFNGTIPCPHDGRRCSQRPPPSLRPAQSGRPKSESTRRQMVVTLRPSLLKIVPTSRSVSPLHGPLSACAGPAVMQLFLPFRLPVEA